MYVFSTSRVAGIERIENFLKIATPLLTFDASSFFWFQIGSKYFDAMYISKARDSIEHHFSFLAGSYFEELN